MRNLFCLIIVIGMLLIWAPEKSYGYVADSQWEMEWEYLTPTHDNRDINTLSVNVLKETPAKTNNFSLYKGITLTRAGGEIFFKDAVRDSSAFGVGPVYLLRYEPFQFDRLSVSVDMSGGLILYSEKFPAGGRYYNFMWRIGPQFIYQIEDNFSVNIGYKLMHVSNGSSMFGKGHNPSYDASGFSLGILMFF